MIPYFLIFFFILVTLFSFLLNKRYIRCPEGKMLVIYGRVADPNRSCEIYCGTAKFVYPVIQDYAFMDLEEYQYDYTQKLYLKNKSKIKVELKLNYEISCNPALAYNAAERFLNLRRRDISKVVNDLIDTIIEDWVLSKGNDELTIDTYRDRKDVIDDLNLRLNKKLNTIGIVIVDIKNSRFIPE